MSNRMRWIGIIAMFCWFVCGLSLGFHFGRAEQNKWWLNRITGREFPVDGSLLREEMGSKIYCVAVKESKGGFTAQPTSCGDTHQPEAAPPKKAGQAMREEMRDFERHEQAGYFVSHEKWEFAVAALKAANGQ